VNGVQMAVCEAVKAGFAIYLKKITEK